MNDNPQQWDEEEGASTNQPGAYPVDPGRLWLTVRRSWRWIPITAGVVAVLSGAYAFARIPVSFESESVLIYEPNTQTDRRELSTLAGIITLPGTLAEAHKTLKLKTPLKLLKRQVDVWFDESSNLVTVVARSGTGPEAAQLGNTLVEVFLKNQSSLGKTRAVEAASLLAGDMASAQQSLDAHRGRYDEFRKAHNIVDFEAELAQAMAAVGSIVRDQSDANAASKALGARASTLSRLAKSRPKMRVQSAVRSNPNSARLAQLRSELAGLSARLAPSHPQIRRLEAQIQSLAASSAKPSSVVSDVVSTANPEFDNLRTSLSAAKTDQAAEQERSKSLEGAKKAAEQHLATLSGIEGEARALLKAVEVAERRVEELRGQLASAREAERAIAPDFRVLSLAPVSPHPKTSKRRIFVAAATIGAALLVLLVLVFRMIRDGRVHTAREAAFWSKLPVVASSRWPRDEKVFHRFVDELNDHATQTTGTTLVISATPRKAALASKLVDWLGSGAPAMDEAEKSVIGWETPSTSDDASPAPGGSSIVVADSARAPLAQRSDAPIQMSFHAWRGDLAGADLRRACRLADRVLVLVGSGDELFTQLRTLPTRLGRDSGVALVVHGLPAQFVDLPDRIGNAERFWGIH